MSYQIDTISQHSHWSAATTLGSNPLVTTYQVRENIPPDPTVRIVFHGLLSFFFDGNRRCQVGIQNTTQGLAQPHRHPHELHVSVWTIVNRCPPVPLSIPIVNSKLIDKVDISVTNPLLLDGVYVFEKNPASAFDRLDPQGTNDPKDWRWVLDVESDLFYPTGVSEISQTLNPSVFINNGLFYTFHKTASTYLLHPDDNSGDKRIGNYAEILACNIYLGLGSSLTLSIPPLPLPITLAGGIGLKYQIDITNNCRKGGRVCDFTPNSGPKEDRNDFYLYYQTFNRPPRRPEYELRLETRINDDPRFDICQERAPNKRIDSSRDSPCGAIVHGQTAMA